jgi:hypothetical protein
MSSKRPEAADDEIAVLIARLRAEVRASGVPTEASAEAVARLAPLPARREAEEFWAVSSDRPFLSKPGRWGRIRGTLLTPVKLALKKLMRWYVEPAFIHQRTFNATVLRLIDELHAQTNGAIARLEDRIARLEEGDSSDSGSR